MKQYFEMIRKKSDVKLYLIQNNDRIISVQSLDN